MNRLRTLSWWGLALAIATAACGGCGLVRTYKCASAAEQNAFNMAARNIYPDDVRLTPEGYLHRCIVAWAGLIIGSELDEGEDEVVVDLLVEHHHFDWLEDFRMGDDIFVLSRRGEGRFGARWILSKSYGIETIREWTSAGNMVVVYGQPISVDRGVIELAPTHVRFILPQRFKFSDYPYGRHAGYHY
jgi:hypothetical protein